MKIVLQTVGQKLSTNFDKRQLARVGASTLERLYYDIIISDMQDEVPTNREKLLLFDNCATKLGRRKREIRRNQYTGEELDDFYLKVHEIIRELDENDIYEIEESFIEKITEEASDDQIRQIYYDMLAEMRRVLRLYKNELGETIDNLNIAEEEYGRFLKHGDRYYYDATEIIISGQPERLLYAF